MNQKYIIAKKDKKTELVISEFAEQATNEFMLLCEQTYKYSDISKAWKAGAGQLIKAIRSTVFFPPVDTVEKLAAAIDVLMREADKETIEVIVDDVRVMSELEAAIDDIGDDEEIEDIDVILTDDDDEELPAEEEE